MEQEKIPGQRRPRTGPTEKARTLPQEQEDALSTVLNLDRKAKVADMKKYLKTHSIPVLNRRRHDLVALILNHVELQAEGTANLAVNHITDEDDLDGECEQDPENEDDDEEEDDDDEQC